MMDRAPRDRGHQDAPAPAQGMAATHSSARAGIAGPLREPVLAFVESCRNATLATLTPAARSRLVPICFVLSADGSSVISPLDDKPKRTSDRRSLARVRDIEARPGVTLLFERWSEDWAKLAWVRLYGEATLLEPSDHPGMHQQAVRALREKYPQYGEHRLESAPMVRIAITDVTAWSATGPP
jgi:PPOX class probable F420-dependent enzyme